MKKILHVLPLAAVLLAGAAPAAMATGTPLHSTAQVVDCYGTYEEGLAEGRIIRQQIIDQYGNGTAAYNDAIAEERAIANEQFRTVPKECRQYWRGVLDGL